MPRGKQRMNGETRRQIVKLARAGCPHRKIAEKVDFSKATVTAVLRPLGGVFRVGWEPSGFRLSLDQRIEIYAGLQAGLSCNEIGRRLKRAGSTISREVRNNGGRHRYKPAEAHRRAARCARRPKQAKLAANAELCERVIAELEAWSSPEQIAGRLRREFPDRPEMWVSHETIYQSIYIQGRGALRRELAECLRTGRAQRRPRSRLERAPILKDTVSISERPAEVEDRAVEGHWEGDLIKGANNRSAIGTLVERSSRFVMLLHLPDGFGAEQVRDAIIDTVKTLPDALRRSLTWDRGVEMARHTEISYGE